MDSKGIDAVVMRRIWIIVLGVFAPALDSTIVTVALHRLSQAWSTSLTTVQWVMTGYLLSMSLAMPLTGWASQRFGAKRMWIAGLFFFLGGSILTGMSWSVSTLIIFRIVQGIGAGFMLPIMMNLLVQSVDKKELGRLMTIITLPMVIVPIFGPVVGGLIVSHLSWRWIFFVNVPLCILAIVFAWHWLPETPVSETPAALDIWGAIWIFPGITGILYGLSEMGRQTSWVHWRILGPLVIGVVFLFFYSFHALRTKQVPLIDVRLFGIRSFTASTTLLFLSGLAMYGALLVLPLYYQGIRGQSALMAGLLLAPQGVGSLLPRIRTVVGKTVARVGIRAWVLAGVGLTVLGTLAFAEMGPRTPEWLLAGSLILRGAGLSTMNIAVSVGVYQDVPAASVPSASSLTRILQQIGGTFGAAIFAMILASSLQFASSGQTVRAYDYTFRWSIGFLVVIVIPALWLPGRKLRQS